MRVEASFVLLTALAVVLLAAPASAQIEPVQTSVCDVYLTANDLGVDLGVPPPPSAVLVDQNTVPGEEGLSVYRLPTRACVPPCHCPLGGAASGGGVPIGGKPIDLATGDVFIVQNDLRVPGLAGGLSLTRTWNSLWPQAESALQVGLFGLNWRSTYEERVFLDSDGFVKYSRGDGDFWTFVWSAGTTYSVAAPAKVVATLSLDSNYTQWTIAFQNGEKRTFSFLAGSLTSIIDRNGNTTQLTYDSSNRLVTVADPGGRHLYLGYQNNSSYLVTSVTSDVGISLSYAYDSQKRLTQVTQPDLTTLSFTFDSNSRVTAVTDSAGKVLESHTYDSQGRGLTSARANGVEAITVTYPH